MARLLQRFIEQPHPCLYLPEETASLEYKVLLNVEPEELEEMLERGWRRFGPAYFRPACSSCGECVSLRLPVATFQPSRSQRRAGQKCARLRCEVGPVRVDSERLALYAAWHANREQTRSWEAAPIDLEEYATHFGFPHPCAREVAYYDEESRDARGSRLVAVGLCDETPRAWSAIYFFYDPAYARCSPGSFHLLNLTRMASRQGKAHVYLGYRVSDCVSMRYKATFRPHELLVQRPAADAEELWVRGDPA
ncbi:MAG TPA: arginyltransferase [Polyangia bacterium]|nr:arginyltransferase [Polyangia bacterium]